jgi:hypothetical protein
MNYRRPCAPLSASKRRRNPAVVVADPVRHAAEELKGPPMARLKRLRAFAGKDLHEERIAVGQ